MNLLAQAVQKQADSVEAAGYETSNYGKLTCTPHILFWGRDGNPTTERPMIEGDAIVKGESDLKLYFEVDITEFNPNIDFTANDRVLVKPSYINEKSPSKNKPTDWGEITEPSLIATFGTQWADKVMASPYVLTGSEDNLKGNKSPVKDDGKGGNVYQVMTFKKVFADKAECQAARDAQFSRSGSSVAAATEDAAIPAEIITQVAGLIKSVGEVSATDMASKTTPFNNYNTAELIAAAKLTL